MPKPHVSLVVFVALSEEAEYFEKFVECKSLEQGYGVITSQIVSPSWAEVGDAYLVCAGGIGVIKTSNALSAFAKHFDFDLVFNLGIAGRVSDDLHIGSVVVPNTVFDLSAAGKVTEASDGTIAFSYQPDTYNIDRTLSALCANFIHSERSEIKLKYSQLKKRYPAYASFIPDNIRLSQNPIATVPAVAAIAQYREL